MLKSLVLSVLSYLIASSVYAASDGRTAVVESDSLSNPAKFADSVYFVDPQYHRMMAVWRVRERAQAIADERHLPGEERTKYVDGEVRNFENF